MALRRYKKNLKYSYTLGIYPTVDLLKKRPDLVQTVILNPRADESEGIREIKKLCEKNDINFDYSSRVIDLLSAKENTYAIGVFNKFSSVVNDTANHVVLVNPMNTGNVGTIIRTMIGFGYKDLVIIRPGVDVFDPKIVRSAMGALFDLRFDYLGTFEEYTEKYPEHKIYPFILKGKNDLKHIEFSSPFSLVFGNEGSGLDKSFTDYEDTVVIKHSGDIDSLNLSVSVALALYQATTF